MNKLKKWIMPLLLIFIVPILVNSSLCYMFRDGVIKEIPTAVYMGDNNSFTRGLIDYFDVTDTFEITTYVDNPYEIEDLIKNDKVRVGIIIPENFYKDLKSYKAPTIGMVYDGTQLSSLSFGRITAGELFVTTKTGGLIKYLQAKFGMSFETAKKVAMSIGIQPKVLFNESRNYKNFLMPGFMASIVQSAVAIALASVIVTKRSMIGDIIKNYILYSVLAFLSFMINIFIQIKIFNIPFKANLNEVMIFTAFFSLCICSIAIFISTAMNNKMDATKVEAILFLPDSILVGYTWPVIAMPVIYQKLVVYIPFYHYADNLRDYMLKGSIPDFSGSIEYFIKVSALFLILSLVVGKIKEMLLIRRERDEVDKGDNKALAGS